MFCKFPVKVGFFIPEEILRAMVEESIAQKEILPSMGEDCVRENLVPLFSFGSTNSKYGKTDRNRIMFWKRVLYYRDFDFFFKNFPKMQPIEQDGIKFII